MKTIATIALLILLPFAAQAVMILDFDWSAPFQTVGTNVVWDYNKSDRPAGANQAFIRDNVPGFDGAVAMFEGINTAYIAYSQTDPNHPGLGVSGNFITSGVYRASWSAAILSWDSETYVVAMKILNLATISFTTGYFDVLVRGNESQVTTLDMWELEQVYSFEAWFDFDLNTCKVFVNEIQVTSGDIQPNLGIPNISFSRPYGSGQVAFGNIQLEMMSPIPEPGTLALLFLGGGFLSMASKKQRVPARAASKIR